MIKLEKKLNDKPELVEQFKKFLKDYSPHFNKSLQSESLLKEMNSYGNKLSDSCDQLCIVGVGGSSLGTKSIYNALGASNTGKEILFFDNIDAYSFEKKFSQVNTENCHWLFISKSGGTKEVLNLIDLIIQKYKNFEANKICTVITDDKVSPLKSWADDNNVITFHIPDEIGGRFSVFTPVGLLPMAYMGKNLDEVVVGVDWALAQVDLVSSICAGLVDSFSRDEWVHLYWIYSDSLQDFGLWLQQLWMESLGKKLKLDGSAAPRVSSLFTARGASDQHSVLQQISEGARDKLVVFLSDERAVSFGDSLKKSVFSGNDELSGFSLGKLCKVEMQSTYEALGEVGVSANLMFLNEVTTKSLAALMTVYMMSVVTIANNLNINPFDQPGVESSKQRTKEILSRLCE